LLNQRAVVQVAAVLPDCADGLDTHTTVGAARGLARGPGSRGLAAGQPGPFRDGHAHTTTRDTASEREAETSDHGAPALERLKVGETIWHDARL